MLPLQRPRKIGAKFTGDDIAPDEYLQPKLDFDYEGKRDRWNGYDTEEHQMKLRDDFNRIEEVFIFMLMWKRCKVISHY